MSLLRAALGLIALWLLLAMSFGEKSNSYKELYFNELENLKNSEKVLLEKIRNEDFTGDGSKKIILKAIIESREKLKSMDFWLRYFHPAPYRKLNGQLEVEWELDAYEKYERPQQRLGAGLSLAEIHLSDEHIQKNHLISLISTSIDSIEVFKADSITEALNSFDHFYFANRLFILNLAALYTTGFECPDDNRVLPELLSMMKAVKKIYQTFDESFPDKKIDKKYLAFYDETIRYISTQPVTINEFDYLKFIRDYVNPLFSMNQKMIAERKPVSKSLIDLFIKKDATSIFEKPWYEAQSVKGIYWQVNDKKSLEEIRQVGKKLFYDPILSGNLKRSCASCHKPTEYFTDTTVSTNLKFDGSQLLTRNTPSLVNVIYNHLAMLDGRHTSLLLQAKDVTTHREEMASNNHEIVTRILSCEEYNKQFSKFAALTTQKKIAIEHIFSAVILYYSGFNYYESPFDDAMNKRYTLTEEETKGFNLFMGKAKCGTCHYVPAFNGVKPPYIDNEFEVLGTPVDSESTMLNTDRGRYAVFPEPEYEMMFAFRTPTIRNSQHTKPYMHNGVFYSLEQVVDFYNDGGGTGKGFSVSSQTLPSDSLHLTETEKRNLIAFINSTSERIKFEMPPAALPASTIDSLNRRKVGGDF